jgi:hypothetical protein
MLISWVISRAYNASNRLKILVITVSWSKTFAIISTLVHGGYCLFQKIAVLSDTYYSWGVCLFHRLLVIFFFEVLHRRNVSMWACSCNTVFTILLKSLINWALSKLVLVCIWIIKATPKALTTYISDKYVTVKVKHLVINKFGCKHAVVVHGNFMFAHYYLSI